jgi:exodeoxyribonuclease X
MKIRIIDTETCGIEAPNLQIVQIAHVDIMQDTKAMGIEGGRGPWQIAGWNQWTINPRRPIPPEASGVHHITDRMVANAPTIEAVLPLVFDGSIGTYAAHHAKYDKLVLSAAGIAVDDYDWLCSYKCGTIKWPDSPSHKNQVLRYYLGLDLQFDGDIPHTALGDAMVTAHLVVEILNSDDVLAFGDWLRISNNPVLLPRVHFGEHATKLWADVPLSYLDWIINKSKGPWDEDVWHTADHWLRIKRNQQRSRGPC